MMGFFKKLYNKLFPKASERSTAPRRGILRSKVHDFFVDGVVGIILFYKKWAPIISAFYMKRYVRISVKVMKIVLPVLQFWRSYVSPIYLPITRSKWFRLLVKMIAKVVFFVIDFIWTKPKFITEILPGDSIYELAASLQVTDEIDLSTPEEVPLDPRARFHYKLGYADEVEEGLYAEEDADLEDEIYFQPYFIKAKKKALKRVRKYQIHRYFAKEAPEFARWNDEHMNKGDEERAPPTNVLEDHEMLPLDYRFFNEDLSVHDSAVDLLKAASPRPLPANIPYFTLIPDPKGEEKKAVEAFFDEKDPRPIKKHWAKFAPTLGLTIAYFKEKREESTRMANYLDRHRLWRYDSLRYLTEYSCLYGYEQFITKPYYEELLIKDKFLDVKKRLVLQEWNKKSYSIIDLLVFFGEEKEVNGDIRAIQETIKEVKEKEEEERQSSERLQLLNSISPFIYRHPTKFSSLLLESNIHFFFDFNLGWYHQIWKFNYFPSDDFWDSSVPRYIFSSTEPEDGLYQFLPLFRFEFFPIVGFETEGLTNLFYEGLHFRMFFEDSKARAKRRLVDDDKYSELKEAILAQTGFMSYIGYINLHAVMNILHPFWLSQVRSWGLSVLDFSILPVHVEYNLSAYIELVSLSQRKQWSTLIYFWRALTGLHDHDKEMAYAFTGTALMIIHLFPPFFPMFRKFYMGLNPWFMDYIPKYKFYKKEEISPFGPAQLEFYNFGFARDHYEDLNLWYKRRIYSLWHKRRWNKYINASEPRFFQSHDRFRWSNNLYYKRYFSLPKILRFSVNSYPSMYGFAYSPERLFKQNSEDLLMYTNRHSLLALNQDDLQLLKSEFPFHNYSDFVNEMGFYSIPLDLGNNGFFDITSQIVGPTVRNVEMLKLWALQYRLGLFHLQPWVSEEMQALLSTAVPTISFWRSHSGRRRHRRLYYKRRFQFTPFNQLHHPKIIAFFYPFFINNKVQSYSKRNKYFTDFHSKPIFSSYRNFFFRLFSHHKLASSLKSKGLSYPSLLPVGSNLLNDISFQSNFRTFDTASLLKFWKLKDLVASPRLMKGFVSPMRLSDFNAFFISSNYHRIMNNHFRRVTSSLHWDKAGTSNSEKQIRFTPPFTQTIYHPSKKYFPGHLSSSLILRQPILFDGDFAKEIEKAWPDRGIIVDNLVRLWNIISTPRKYVASLFKEDSLLFNINFRLFPKVVNDFRPLVDSDKEFYNSLPPGDTLDADVYSHYLPNYASYTLLAHYLKKLGFNWLSYQAGLITSKFMFRAAETPPLSLQSDWEKFLSDPRNKDLLLKDVSYFVSQLPFSNAKSKMPLYIREYVSNKDRVRSRSFFLKNKVKSQYIDFLFSQRQQKQYLDTFYSFFPKWLQRLSHQQKFFFDPEKYILFLSSLKGSRSHNSFFLPPFNEKHLSARPSIYNYYWGRGRMKRSFFLQIKGAQFFDLRRKFYNPEVGRKALANLAPFFANERELARLHHFTHHKPVWGEEYLPPFLQRYPPLRRLKERFNIFFAHKYRNYFLEDYYLKHYKSPASIIRQVKSSSFARRYPIHYLRKSDYFWNGALRHRSFLDPLSQRGIESVYNWDDISSITKPYLDMENWYSKFNNRSPLFISRRLFSKRNIGSPLKSIFPNSLGSKDLLPWKESDFVYTNRFSRKNNMESLNSFHYPLRFGIRTASGPNIYSSRIFYLPISKPVSLSHMRKKKPARSWLSYKLKKNFYSLLDPLFRLLNTRFVAQHFPIYENRLVTRNRMARVSLRRWIKGRHVRSPNYVNPRFQNDIRNAHDFLLRIPSFLLYRMKEGHIYNKPLLTKLIRQVKQGHMTQVDSYLRSLSPRWKRISFIENTRTLFSRLQHKMSRPMGYYNFFSRAMWRRVLKANSLKTSKGWPGVVLFHSPYFFSDKKRRFRKLGARGFDLAMKRSRIPSSYSDRSFNHVSGDKRKFRFLLERHIGDLSSFQPVKYYSKQGSKKFPLNPDQMIEPIPRNDNYLKTSGMNSNPYKFHRYVERQRSSRLLKKDWSPRTNYQLNNLSRAVHNRVPFETHLHRLLHLYYRKISRKDFYKGYTAKLAKFFHSPITNLSRLFFSSSESPEEGKEEREEKKLRRRRIAEALERGESLKSIRATELAISKAKEEMKKKEQPKAKENQLEPPENAVQSNLPYTFDREQFFQDYVGIEHDSPIGITRFNTGRRITMNSLLFYLFGTQKRFALNQFRHIALRKKYQYWFKNTSHSSYGESYLDNALKSNWSRYYDLDALRSSYLGRHHASLRNRGPFRSYWRRSNYSRPSVKISEEDASFIPPTLYSPTNFAYPLFHNSDQYRSLFTGLNRYRKSIFPFSNLSFPTRNELSDFNSFKHRNKLSFALSKSNAFLLNSISLPSPLQRFSYLLSNKLNLSNLFFTIRDQDRMRKLLKEGSKSPSSNFFSLFRKRETSYPAIKPAIRKGKRRLLPFKEIELQIKKPSHYYFRKQYESAMTVPSIINYLSSATPRFKFEFPRKVIWKKRKFKPFMERDYQRTPYDWDDYHRTLTAVEIETEQFRHPLEGPKYFISSTPLDNRFALGQDSRHFYYTYMLRKWSKRRRSLYKLSKRTVNFFERQKLKKFIYYPKKLFSRNRLQRRFFSSSVFHRKWIESFYLRKLRRLLLGSNAKKISGRFLHEKKLFFIKRRTRSLLKLLKNRRFKKKKKRYTFHPWNYYYSFVTTFSDKVEGGEDDLKYRIKNRSHRWNRQFKRKSLPLFQSFSRSFSRLFQGLDSKLFPYYSPRLRRGRLKKYVDFSFNPIIKQRLRRRKMKIIPSKKTTYRPATLTDARNLERLFHFFKFREIGLHKERMLRFLKRRLHKDLIYRKDPVTPLLFDYHSFYQKRPVRNRHFLITPAKFFSPFRYYRRSNKLKRFDQMQLKRRFAIKRRWRFNIFPDPATRFVKQSVSFDGPRKIRALKYFFSFDVMPRKFQDFFQSPLNQAKHIEFDSNTPIHPRKYKESMFKDQKSRILEFSRDLEKLENNYFSLEKNRVVTPAFYKRFFFDYQKKHFLFLESHPERRTFEPTYTPLNFDSSLGVLESFIEPRYAILREKLNRSKNLELLRLLSDKNLSTKAVIGRAALKLISDRYHSKQRRKHKELLNKRFFYPDPYRTPRLFSFAFSGFPLPAMASLSRYYYNQKVVAQKHLTDEYVVSRSKPAMRPAVIWQHVNDRSTLKKDENTFTFSPLVERKHFIRRRLGRFKVLRNYWTHPLSYLFFKEAHVKPTYDKVYNDLLLKSPFYSLQRENKGVSLDVDSNRKEDFSEFQRWAIPILMKPYLDKFENKRFIPQYQRKRAWDKLLTRRKKYIPFVSPKVERKRINKQNQKLANLEALRLAPFVSVGADGNITVPFWAFAYLRLYNQVQKIENILTIPAGLIAEHAVFPFYAKYQVPKDLRQIRRWFVQTFNRDLPWWIRSRIPKVLTFRRAFGRPYSRPITDYEEHSIYTDSPSVFSFFFAPQAYADAVDIGRERFFPRSSYIHNSLNSRWGSHVLDKADLPFRQTKRSSFQTWVESHPYHQGKLYDLDFEKSAELYDELEYQDPRWPFKAYERDLRLRFYYLYPKTRLFLERLRSISHPHYSPERIHYNILHKNKTARNLRGFFWRLAAPHRKIQDFMLNHYIYTTLFNPVQLYNRTRLLKHDETRKFDTYQYKGNLLKHFLQEKNNFSFLNHMNKVRFFLDKKSLSFFNSPIRLFSRNPHFGGNGPFRANSLYRLSEFPQSLRRKIYARGLFTNWRNGIGWHNGSVSHYSRDNARTFHGPFYRYGAFLKSAIQSSRELNLSERNLSYLLDDQFNISDWKNKFYTVLPSRAIELNNYHNSIPFFEKDFPEYQRHYLLRFLNYFTNDPYVKRHVFLSSLFPVYKNHLQSMVYPQLMNSLIMAYNKLGVFLTSEEERLLSQFNIELKNFRKRNLSAIPLFSNYSREFEYCFNFLSYYRNKFQETDLENDIYKRFRKRNSNYKLNPKALRFPGFFRVESPFRMMYLLSKGHYLFRPFNADAFNRERSRFFFPFLFKLPIFSDVSNYYFDLYRMMPNKNMLEEKTAPFVPLKAYSLPSLDQQYYRRESGLGPNLFLDRIFNKRAFIPSNNKQLKLSFERFYQLSKRFLFFKTHYYSLKRWYFIYGNKKVGSYSLLSWRTHKKALSDYFYSLSQFQSSYQNSKNQLFKTFKDSFELIPSSLDSLKVRYGSFLKDRIKREFQLQTRSASLEKKAIVVVSRNLVKERRNLQYKESYRKYKPYFVKPFLSWKDNYSTYIDFIHEKQLIPLFNIKKELQVIRENKKLLLYEAPDPGDAIYATSITRKLKFVFNFYYDFYYDVVVDFYIWFPFYDFYNALSFLF